MSLSDLITRCIRNGWRISFRPFHDRNRVLITIKAKEDGIELQKDFSLSSNIEEEALTMIREMDEKTREAGYRR